MPVQAFNLAHFISGAGVPVPVLNLDASILSSITRGVYGAVGTNEGQICTNWASQVGGVAATQATEANTPLYDEMNLAGQPCIVFGGNADDFTPTFSTTGYVLPSITYGTPFTIVMAGRIQTAGAIAELSTGVTSAPGILLTEAVTDVNNAALQTSTMPVPGATFTAAMTSALFCLLESDKGITLTSGSVTTWADQSGHGHNFTDVTGIPYVASGGANNQPYLNCTGAGQLVCASFVLAPPHELYMVIDAASDVSTTTAIDFNGGNVNAILQTTASQFRLRAGYNHANFCPSSVAGTSVTGPNLPHVWGIQNPSAGNISSTLDSGQAVLGTGVSFSLTNAILGRGISIANFWLGKIYALYVFSRALTAAERAILVQSAQIGLPTGYILQKYAIEDNSWKAGDTNHVWVWQSDGTDAGLTLERDTVPIPLATNATAPGNGPITTVGTVGSAHSLGNPTIAGLGLLKVYNSKLTTAQKAVDYAYCNGKWPLAPTSGAQAWEVQGYGDSIMAGVGVNQIPARTILGRLVAYRGPAFGQGLGVGAGSFSYPGVPKNFGVTSTQLVQGSQNINSVLAAAVFSTALPKIIFVNGGTNDIGLGGRSSAQVITDWGTVAATAQTVCAAAGGVNYVIVHTIPYRVSGTTETTRLAANVGIRAAVAGWTTANAIFILCDIGADAMLGSHGTTVTTPYFVNDGVHPSGIGYERWYGILAPLLVAAGI
jgi:lysophospholipase L1-like esterase